MYSWWKKPSDLTIYHGTITFNTTNINVGTERYNVCNQTWTHQQTSLTSETISHLILTTLDLESIEAIPS